MSSNAPYDVKLRTYYFISFWKMSTDESLLIRAGTFNKKINRIVFDLMLLLTLNLGVRKLIFWGQ